MRNKTIEEEMKYCDCKCSNLLCLRHIKNAPWGEKIIVDSEYHKEKNGTCKYQLMM